MNRTAIFVAMLWPLEQRANCVKPRSTISSLRPRRWREAINHTAC